jgi:hypothetical protein
MSLGLSIFLSALVFAVIYLYRLTRDRWNWRKIVKRLSLGILLFVLLIAFAVTGFYFWSAWIPKQAEYAGLRLGMTMDEVKYIKQKPDSTYIDNCRQLLSSRLPGGCYVATDKLGTGLKIEDNEEWIYSNENIDIVFERSAAVRICLDRLCGSDCARTLISSSAARAVISRVRLPNSSIYH